MKKLIGVFVLICLMPILLSGQNTYYVSKTGSDSDDGSSTSPWRTIQHAVSTVATNDIIEVAAGVYEEIITITHPLTINGTPGTIIKPPSITKAIFGAVISNNYLTKSNSPNKRSIDMLIIKGIEIDGDYNPSVNTGILLDNVDVILENIVIHRFLGDDSAYGIMIESPGKVHITGCEIDDIGSTLTNTLAAGIMISGESPVKSDTDGYDIIIEHNTLSGIYSLNYDYLSPFAGARAIHIMYAGNVLIHNNVISNFYQADKGTSDNIHIGLWLESLGGENTISGNIFTDLYVASFIWATPLLTFENNTIYDSEIGVYVISNEASQFEKSNDKLSQYNIRLPVVSPGKSQKSFDTGRWIFSDNTIFTSEGYQYVMMTGIFIGHMPGYEPDKNGGGLDVTLHGNIIENNYFGLVIQNYGVMNFQFSDNTIKSNYRGILCFNAGSGIMGFQATANNFLSNKRSGMVLLSMNDIYADIAGNTVEGSATGIEISVDLPFSASVINNLIRFNQIGLYIEAFSFENMYVNQNHIVKNSTYGILVDVIPGSSKNNILPLDASCNWWGLTNPFYVQGNASGNINIFPFLLTDVTDPLIEGYDCGGQPPPVPLSNMGLLIFMICIAGYAAYRFPGRG